MIRPHDLGYPRYLLDPGSRRRVWEVHPHRGLPPCVDDAIGTELRRMAHRAGLPE